MNKSFESLSCYDTHFSASGDFAIPNLGTSKADSNIVKASPLEMLLAFPMTSAKQITRP